MIFRFSSSYLWLPLLWLIMPQLLPHTILLLPHTMPLPLPTMNPNMKITPQHMNTPMPLPMTMLVLTLGKMKNVTDMLLADNTMLLFQIVVSKL